MEAITRSARGVVRRVMAVARKTMFVQPRVRERKQLQVEWNSLRESVRQAARAAWERHRALEGREQRCRMCGDEWLQEQANWAPAVIVAVGELGELELMGEWYGEWNRLDIECADPAWFGDEINQ